MGLNKQAPMFLGVCYKYANEWGISVETLRIVTVIATFFFSPLFAIYIIIGILGNPSLYNTNTTEESYTEENEYYEEEPIDTEIIINGVRGEKAVINDVREY